MTASAQVDCIQTPQNETCADYRFPSSTNVVTDFCMMMDNMPGCTIYHICQDNTYNASTSGNGVCTHFSLAQDLCFDMPSMDSQTCGQLSSMCASGSVVEECQTTNLTATMPTYSQLTTALTSVCSATPQPSEELCARCSSSSGWNCDLLSTFTAICATQPNITECSLTEAFCDSVSAYNWPICITNPPFAPTAPSSMNMPGMNMPGMDMPAASPSAPSMTMPGMTSPTTTPTAPSTPSELPTPPSSAASLAPHFFVILLALVALL